MGKMGISYGSDLRRDEAFPVKSDTESTHRRRLFCRQTDIKQQAKQCGSFASALRLRIAKPRISAPDKYYLERENGKTVLIVISVRKWECETILMEEIP